MTASTAITPFNFNDHAVRVLQIEDAPWFVATDVAESLGYKSPKDAASYLDDDEKGSAIVRTPGGDQKLTVINESGLYALVLRSRKPEARKFAKWVTAEVLPSIRKTGQYARPHNPAIDYDSISPAQKQDLKEIVNAIVQAGVQKYGETWARLQSKFRVNKYEELPASQYEEARRYLIAKLPGGYKGAVTEEATTQALPNMDRTRAAFDAASQAAASVQTAVFNAVLSGNDEWKYSRWMLAFIDDSAKGSPAYVRQMDRGSFVTTWPRLVRDVGTGECMCTSAELLDMAAACMQRLQQRGGPARLAA